MEAWVWGVGGIAVAGALWIYMSVSIRARDRLRRERLQTAWGRAADRGGPMPNRPLREAADARQIDHDRLDDQTWSDLLLPQVVERVDHTVTVFGAGYRGVPVRVASCININDDLLGGRSYYRAELDTILGVLARAAEGGTLVVLDEIFRGTNPLERTAAATAVLDHLASQNLVLAATHDLEIGDRVGDAFSEAHFCEIASAEDDELDFDYRLRTGRIERPNAIALLGRAGYPAALVERALALVHRHELSVTGPHGAPETSRQ